MKADRDLSRLKGLVFDPGAGIVEHLMNRNLDLMRCCVADIDVVEAILPRPGPDLAKHAGMQFGQEVRLKASFARSLGPPPTERYVVGFQSIELSTVDYWHTQIGELIVTERRSMRRVFEEVIGHRATNRVR